MNQILQQVLIDISGVLVPFVVAQIISLLTRIIGIKKMQHAQSVLDSHKGITQEAVKYVEQKFGLIDNQAKYKIAQNMIISQCSKYGIKIAPEAVEMLIDSTIKDFKLQFGEQWSATVDQTQTSNNTNPYAESVQKVTQTAM